MTLEETKKLLMTMRLFYQNWKPSADPELIAKAWYSDLKNYSANDIGAAFAAYRAQGNQFPPAQPMILVNFLVNTTYKEIPEMEAWGMVARAIKNGIYHSQEEFDKLPPTVQKAVGTPAQLSAWAVSPSEQVATVGQSNFLKAYRNAVLREKKEAVMPGNIKIGQNTTPERPTIALNGTGDKV